MRKSDFTNSDIKPVTKYPFRYGDETPYGVYLYKRYNGPYVFGTGQIDDEGNEVTKLVYPNERSVLQYLINNKKSSEETKERAYRYYRAKIRVKRLMEMV